MNEAEENKRGEVEVGAAFRIFWLSCVIACLLSAQAAAQPSSAWPSIAGIDNQIATLESAADLDEADVADAVSALSQAKRLIGEAERRTAQVDLLVSEAARAADVRAQLNDERQVLEQTGPDLSPLETSQELRSAVTYLQSERTLLDDAREQLLLRQTELASRAGEIAAEISGARASLDGLGDPRPNANEAGLIDSAATTLLRVRRLERMAAIADLQRELETIPARQPIVSARIDLIDLQLNHLDLRMAVLQRQLSDARMDQADAARAEANAERDRLSEAAPAVQLIAEENVGLASELQNLANQALVIEQDISMRVQQTAQISLQAETVERILATGRVTDEVGVLLRQVRNGLPGGQELRLAVLETQERRIMLQLSLILWQDSLRTLNSVSNPGRYLLVEASNGGGAIPDTDDAQLAADTLVQHRNRLLEDLIAAALTQADRLTDKEITLRETQLASQSLLNTLDRRLLWLPSNNRPLRDLGGNLVSGVSWFVDPETWSGVRRDLGRGWQSAAGLWIVAFALAIALLLAREPLQSVLGTLHNRVGKVAQDRYWTTPFALVVGGLIALPLPLVLAAMAGSVWIQPDLTVSGRAFAGGGLALASLMLAMYWLASLAKDEGVLATHFGWSSRAIQFLGRESRRFLRVQAAALVLTIVALYTGRPDLQYGIGLLSFMALSASWTMLGYNIFKPDRGLVSLIVSDETPSTITLLGLASFALAPMIIGFLPLFGYFETAVALMTRIVLSAGLIIFAAVAYGTLRRLLLIAQRRLALRRAVERRAKREAERAERAALGETETDETPERAAPLELVHERQMISNQTRRILLYATGLGILAGLVTTWATILPALGIANEITLWTGTEVLNGVRIQRDVTLWNLMLFVFLIAGGAIAAYNVRGLLEIGVLQRLRLSPGARYAVNTIVGYALIGAGTIAAFLQLGLDWSRLQWVVAALGVGLGFGLQEIVANFISGLIILFERPVRVGDTVTIGELSGTVSNIAIRATTITDFDNREVLLPNKSIITENVTNWTLQDSVMRLVIHIGVAYGSDLDVVRRILFEVIHANEDVLKTPAPAVFFMKHGDSSLDHEVRIFISNPRKRYRVRHEVNTEINKALASAGIEIPFPQRDLHIRSQAES